VDLNHYIYKKMSTLQQIAKASRLAERESNREKLHQRQVANGIAKAERRARSLPISTLPQLDQVQTTPGSRSPELISLRKNNASNQNKMASLPVTEVPLAPPSTPVAVPTGVAKGVSANNLAQGLGLVAVNRAAENAPANKQKQLLNNLKNKINEANRAFPDSIKFCNKNVPSALCEQYILTRMGMFRKLTMKASNIAKKAASIAVTAVGTVGGYLVKLEQAAAATATAAAKAASGAIVAGGKEALALAKAAERTVEGLVVAIAKELTLSEEHRRQLEAKIAELKELIRNLKLPELSLDIVKTLTEIRRCVGEILEILKTGAYILLMPLGLLVPRFDYFLKKDPLTGNTKFTRNLKSIKKRFGNFGRKVGTFGRSLKSRAILAGLAAKKAISGSFAQMKATMERLSGVEQARLVKKLMEQVAKLEAQGSSDRGAMMRLQDAIAAVSPEVVAQATVAATPEEQAAINAAMRASAPRTFARGESETGNAHSNAVTRSVPSFGMSTTGRLNALREIGSPNRRNSVTQSTVGVSNSLMNKQALANAAAARKAKYGNAIAAAEAANVPAALRSSSGTTPNLTQTTLAPGQSMSLFEGGSKRSRKNRSRKNRKASRKNRKNRKGSRKH